MKKTDSVLDIVDHIFPKAYKLLREFQVMSKEERPQVERRVTRSSAAIASNKADVTEKTNDPHIPTLEDLLSGEDPISLDDLLESFPGRNTQILELLQLFGPQNSPMFPALVYGGPSTGKTSVILQTFRHLFRPFVYVSCLTCYNPRTLFESVLNQLLLHQKNAENGYSSKKRCEKPADFVNSLHQALTSVLNSLRRNSGKLSTKKTERRDVGCMIYLIFDDLELVREWDKGSIILPFLLNLYETLRMNDVGIIFISNSSPDTYYTSMGYVEPTPIYFPDYIDDDIYRILLRNQRNRKLYSSFLDVALRPFCRITRRVDEISVALEPLFKKYCEPLRDSGATPNKDMKRRLFNHVKSHISPSLNVIFKISSQPSEVEISKESMRNGVLKNSEGCEVTGELDFHMSTSAKYLLISAFLASRNPATLDASLFDSTGGRDNRKRKRKPSEKSMGEKEMAEEESLMKGPGTFPLERLLAIFQCITYVTEASLEDGERDGEVGSQSGDIGLMSDVLLQISSLSNANFIVKGGSCPLEGSLRYRSTVSEDMALKVARSLKFPLSKYMYRR